MVVESIMTCVHLHSWRASVGGGRASSPDVSNAPACSDTADCTCASLEGHSYWFCGGVLDWPESEAHCQTQSMHLVRVDSMQENDFLVQTGTTLGLFDYSGYIRIGADDQAVLGEWLWTDGTQFWQGGGTGMAVGGLYTNWVSGSPSLNGTRQCGALLPTGLWQDRSCKFVATFVCEAP
jgi:hypothetical protein